MLFANLLEPLFWSGVRMPNNCWWDCLRSQASSASLFIVQRTIRANRLCLLHGILADLLKLGFLIVCQIQFLGQFRHILALLCATSHSAALLLVTIAALCSELPESDDCCGCIPHAADPTLNARPNNVKRNNLDMLNSP